MIYKGEYTNEISFPLGGIGSGSIGFSGNGRLIDWEIFNRPSKGSSNGYTHFAIKATTKDGNTKTYILNGDLKGSYMGQYQQSTYHGYGFGPDRMTMAGFPHFKNSEFNGEFPIAELKLWDEKFPAEVKMTAFNPFIPNDEDNSSIPGAFFEIEVKNTTDEEIEYQVGMSLHNPFKNSHNENEKDGNISFLKLISNEDKNNISYGDMTVATDCESTAIQTYWYRGAWMDEIVTYWNDFSANSALKDRNYENDGNGGTGTLAGILKINPKETKKIRFVLSWNIPNNHNYWTDFSKNAEKDKSWKNYYAILFENSEKTAEYSLKNWDNLYERTLKFKNIIHSTTLPQPVLEAINANLAVLKSPTVLRLEDGSFYGWEGVHEKEGSCEGTCQHVWNYAYALCFLFPKLERSVRDLEFKYSTEENGRMGFRLMLPVGSGVTEMRACVDGQMGAVIKSYREWKISGDNEWLKGNWNSIKKVLEYAWSKENYDKWDLNKDGVLEGRQHHTLDMELFGPSSWLEGMYLTALKCASEMAEFLGDTEKAEEYNDLFLKGQKWTKKNLFNEKYFIQKINLDDKGITDEFNASETYWNEETKEIKYQIGEGSSIDQMLAQWHADILGLGDIFDKNQVETALNSMIENNYKPVMGDFANPWRIFSLNDESGSVICDYPSYVRKPKIPVPYCEETMTGFEYSFAGLLFSKGKFEDGNKVVKAIRDRFDGKKRNPWNEFECGSNYARSMASYALLPILSGFEFDLPKRHLGFNPYKKDGFSCIWSVENAWGKFKIDKSKVTLTLAEGEIKLSSLGLKFSDHIKSLKTDGKDTDFKFEKGVLLFNETTISKEIEIQL